MKKKTFFIRTAVVVLLLSIFICVSLRLVQFYETRKFFREVKSLAGKEFKKSDAEYSFFIKKLGLGSFELGFKGRKQFPAASLIKLPILAAAFYAIEERKVSLEDIITISKKDITGGSGRIKALSVPRKLTFGKILELMISSSDNTAANKVIQILGFEYINHIFKKIGLSETILARRMMDFSLRSKGIENYTTALDLAYLLEKIYKKKLISRELSDLALSFLKKQKVNDRLPRYLPSGVVVAHKTGLERSIVHDAGVVFYSRGNYLIFVLVAGDPNYAKSKKFIAQVSLLAYNDLIVGAGLAPARISQ